MIEDFAPDEVKWCKTCVNHKQGLCDECGIKLTSETGKFKSLTHHFHPTSIAGIPGTMAIYQALCGKCAALDEKAYYSKTP